jgi:hypothetical protein
MDDDTVKHLWSLKKVNEPLITGLKTAFFVMQKWDELTPGRRQSIIGKLQGLIIKSNKIYGMEPPH